MRAWILPLVVMVLATSGAQAADPAIAAKDGAAATAAQTPHSPVVVLPAMTVVPNYHEFLRGYPVKGWNDHVVGSATIRCDLSTSGTLSGCVVVEEAPLDEGFGDAALKLASSYRMSPYTVDGVAVDHKVRTKIEFPLPQLPGEPPSTESLVGHPWWTCPDPISAPNRYYPAAAQGRAVPGVADVECRILTTGKFVACTWTSESPAGYGFGDKAEKLACALKFDSAIPDGATPEIRIFRKLVHFKIGS